LAKKESTRVRGKRFIKKRAHKKKGERKKSASTGDTEREKAKASVLEVFLSPAGKGGARRGAHHKIPGKQGKKKSFSSCSLIRKQPAMI